MTPFRPVPLPTSLLLNEHDQPDDAEYRKTTVKYIEPNTALNIQER